MEEIIGEVEMEEQPLFRIPISITSPHSVPFRPQICNFYTLFAPGNCETNFICSININNALELYELTDSHLIHHNPHINCHIHFYNFKEC